MKKLSHTNKTYHSKESKVLSLEEVKNMNESYEKEWLDNEITMKSDPKSFSNLSKIQRNNSMQKAPNLKFSTGSIDIYMNNNINDLKSNKSSKSIKSNKDPKNNTHMNNFLINSTKLLEQTKKEKQDKLDSLEKNLNELNNEHNNLMKKINVHIINLYQHILTYINNKSIINNYKDCKNNFRSKLTKK